MPILSAQERLGTVLGRKYKLTKILGEGGMGVVFEGLDQRFDRKVAVKFLHAQFARDQNVVRRFFNEAKAAAKLSDDHVVAVHDFDTDPADDCPYIVLEYLEGKSLGETLFERGTLSPAEAWEALSPMMDVLHHAHEQGIIHRDLKPDNLHLSLNRKKRVVPKVLDFGVAKLVEGTSPTQTKTIVGTPTYMAPEQANASDVGPWSDVWSMGVIWFEVLSGRMHHDFPRDVGTMAVILQVVSQDPLRLVDVAPDIDPALAAIVQNALVRDRRQRFTSMGEFHDALSLYFLGGTELREPSIRTVLDRSSAVPETVNPEDVAGPFSSIDPLASTQHPGVALNTPGKPVPSTPIGTIPGLKKVSKATLVLGASVIALIGGVATFSVRDVESEPSVAPVSETSPPPVTRTAAPLVVAPLPAVSGVPSSPDTLSVGVDVPAVVVETRPHVGSRSGHDSSAEDEARMCLIQGDYECVIRRLDGGQARSARALGMLLQAQREARSPSAICATLDTLLTRYGTNPEASRWRQLRSATCTSHSAPARAEVPAEVAPSRGVEVPSMQPQQQAVSGNLIPIDD